LSFAAPANFLPVQLFIDLKFSPSEFNALSNAAIEWNQFGAEREIGTIFKVEPSTILKRLGLTNFMIGQFEESNHVYLVRVESDSEWSSSEFNELIPAATLRYVDRGVLIRQESFFISRQ